MYALYQILRHRDPGWQVQEQGRGREVFQDLQEDPGQQRQPAADLRGNREGEREVMAKKLVSFRLDEDRLEELQELASVYTKGNCTQLIEDLIRRMYFLEPLALQGKYRTPGFGIAGKDRQHIKDAWDTWVTQGIGLSNQKPDTAQANQKVFVTINGDYTSLKRSEIRDLAHLLRIPIDTRCVYTIIVKKAADQEQQPEQKPIVYTHGKVVQLSEGTIREICKATGLFYNPKQAFNIHAYWG